MTAVSQSVERELAVLDQFYKTVHLAGRDKGINRIGKNNKIRRLKHGLCFGKIPLKASDFLPHMQHSVIVTGKHLPDI